MKTSLAIIICLCCAAAARAHVAWGIVVDQRGQVYFADVLHGGTVWKIDAQGRLSPFVTGKHSHGLGIDAEDNLYGEHVSFDSAANRWATVSWKATPVGAVSELFTYAEATPAEDVLLFDATGARYFWRGNVNVKGESQIVKLSFDGQVSVLAGGAWGHRDGVGQAAQFRKVGALAWGPEGALYVTEGGGGAVRRITMNGEVTTLGGYPLAAIAHGAAEEATAASLMGLTVDARGNVFVADHDHGCLQRITPEGGVSALAASGWLWKPSGAAEREGILYVLEYSLATSDALGVLGLLGIGPYARVRKVQPDGNAVTLATVWGRNTTGFVVAMFAITALALFVRRWRRRRQKRT